MNRNIISRLDAMRSGSKFFFTGRPCIRGHVVQRYVSSGGCTACMAAIAEDQKALYKAARTGRFEPLGMRLVTVKVPTTLLDAFKAMCAALSVTIVEPKRDTVVKSGAAFVFPSHLTPPHPGSPKPEILK